MARTAVETTIEQHQASAGEIAEIHTMADAWDAWNQLKDEASENAVAVARKFGYDGTLTVGALEDEIRFYQRRTVEGVLELGKRLLILKELSPHGEFIQRVQMLGIDRSLAKKFMTATVKFSNVETFPHLKLGSQSKLLELLVLDDGEIEALESGETVRGVTLDKIETMSVSELKKALRDANERMEAKDKVISDKTGVINNQAEKLALLENQKRHEVEERFMPGHIQIQQMQDYSTKLVSMVSASLRSHIVQLFDQFDNDPPAHIRLAAAQSLGLVVTAAYNVAGDLLLDVNTDTATAANDPAKADAEEFMKWQQAQQSAE